MPVAVDPWTHVRKSDSCWLWAGTLDPDGYGKWWDRKTRRYRQAHREVYEQLVGPIPAGLGLDHECHKADPSCPGGRCDHRRCVRPDHLVPRTQRDNVLRGKTIPASHAAKAQCPVGHPYDEANTYHTPRGARGCRRCRSAAVQRSKRRSRSR